MGSTLAGHCPTMMQPPQEPTHLPKAKKRWLYKSYNNTILSCFEEDIKIPISFGQIRYEFSHLQKKLKDRDRKKYLHNQSMSENLANEIFTINKDMLSPESWEKRAE